MAKNAKNIRKTNNSQWFYYYQRLSDFNFYRKVLFDTKYLVPVSVLLVIAEFILSVLIVEKVKYTEIDWKAYMQEVEGFVNGTYDYSKLKGDTGPLVYPAGFVYIFTILYYLTSYGTDIKLAQYIYVLLYVGTLIVILRIYVISKKVPPYVLILMCFTTYRIHSIYMLRLFNDPFASLFLYLSLNFFLANYFTLGSILFSIGVSIKMNILLYAPALLLAYLTILGIKQTIVQLTICAAVQVVLALPFILTDPSAYLKGAFDLGRIFLFEWTVNWRFLPESIFVSREFHLALLALHICLLLVFFRSSLKYFQSYAKLKYIESDVRRQLKNRTERVDMRTSSQLFILPMFLANFIGVACSRSLHYQFYVWYYHTLPYLLWSTNLPVKIRLVLLGLIELSWNTFPSTVWSSAILHISHFIILVYVFIHFSKIIKESNKV